MGSCHNWIIYPAKFKNERLKKMKFAQLLFTTTTLSWIPWVLNTIWQCKRHLITITNSDFFFFFLKAVESNITRDIYSKQSRSNVLYTWPLLNCREIRQILLHLRFKRRADPNCWVIFETKKIWWRFKPVAANYQLQDCTRTTHTHLLMRSVLQFTKRCWDKFQEELFTGGKPARAQW